MDYAHIFRRLFHLCGPLVLVYYIMPDTLLWVPKYAWVFLTLAGLLTIEVIRLYTGKMFFGLRDYEKGQISAYAWAGIAITIAFFCFPPTLVICAVIGMCWTDPLIGEMRKKRKMKHYPALPLCMYFVIVTAYLFLFSDIKIISVLGLGIVGSLIAIAIEKPKLPIDDDFLMLVVPLVALTLVHEYLIIVGLV
jgi:dolichol kinase